MNSTNKAFLYAIVLFLTPFSVKLEPLLWDGKWPTPQAVVACLLAGTVAAAVGLRAYYDGSAAREKEERGQSPNPKDQTPNPTP